MSACGDTEKKPASSDTGDIRTETQASEPGTAVKESAKAVVDYSNANEGYIGVRYTGKSKPQLKITAPSGNAYDYVFTPTGDWQYFVLSEGSGTYTIALYEIIVANKAMPVTNVSVEANIADSTAPFLYPNCYVNYTGSTKAVKRTGSSCGFPWTKARQWRSACIRKRRRADGDLEKTEELLGCDAVFENGVLTQPCGDELTLRVTVKEQDEDCVICTVSVTDADGDTVHTMEITALKEGTAD